MRKKVKEAFSCEDGFTLVELLAVIVILGIIVAIAIPAVGSVIDRADSDADDAEAALIEDAARLYVITESVEKLNWNPTNNEAHILVKDLKSKGYLEERAADKPLTGQVIVKRNDMKDTNLAYKYDPTANATSNR